MHDLVIRNAKLVDGTGAPARVADVSVAAGRFVEVGAKLPTARREIEADGLLMTPGWVDIHTHYDGQATWDSQLTPSCWHGVTTAVFGNCGVGFAPVKPGTERYLINLMEGVEDIPETVLAEGIDFSWESFEQYLDVLDARRYSMDVGAQVPHTALRFYVMGERGADHAARPTAEEAERMGEHLERSLRAGALGFSTSRTIKHRAKDGGFTPGLTAEEPELAGLARAMRRADSGVIEVNSDFAADDFEHVRAMAELAGRPLTVLLLQVNNAPDRWRETLTAIHAARERGQEVTGQVGTRPIGVNLALEGTVHPFTTHPLWLEMESLRPEERTARILSDPELRRRLWAERPDDENTRRMQEMFPRTFRIGDFPDFEPRLADGVSACAKIAGRDEFDLALEWLLADGGKAVLYNTFENYTAGDLGVVHRLLCDDATICGLGDAGAHVGFLCDAAGPTSMLTLWTRDRVRGPRIPLEFLVRKQTLDTARAGSCGARRQADRRRFRDAARATRRSRRG